MTPEIERTIDDAWETRDQITPATKGPVREAVEAALDGLDRGNLRVAQKEGSAWRVHQWLKKAVLLSFRLNDMSVIGNGPGAAAWWDKIPSKFAHWDAARFRARSCAIPPSSRPASC
jgi:2,3,4,5-tetrahydropyridine-2,6-dicarboxylate N-succinyltransferase